MIYNTTKMNSEIMMCHRVVTVPHYAEHWSEATSPLPQEGVWGWVDKRHSPMHWKSRKASGNQRLFCFSSAPSGARTLDPNIKSVVLYQLS